MSKISFLDFLLLKVLELGKIFVLFFRHSDSLLMQKIGKIKRVKNRQNNKFSK